MVNFSLTEQIENITRLFKCLGKINLGKFELFRKTILLKKM